MIVRKAFAQFRRIDRCKATADRLKGYVEGETLGMTAAIGIVCKAPKPGGAKSRLATAIGSVAAAQLSGCFLRDVAAAIAAIPAHVGSCGYGVYAPAGAEEILRQLFPPSFGLLLQADADLGKVLFGATRDLLAVPHDCVLLVNGDSPTLPTAFLIQAIEVLRRPGDRLVLGPASDGGYYLIGLKQAHRAVFRGIEWGTAGVARSTLRRAQELALETTLLPEWYDVDDAETFGWLRDELAGRLDRFQGGGPASATRAFLATASEGVR
jgi:rSAM/selenodomain-associated transferase 1